jgi:hypothetical protein
VDNDVIEQKVIIYALRELSDFPMLPGNNVHVEKQISETSLLEMLPRKEMTLIEFPRKEIYFPFGRIRKSVWPGKRI